MGKIHSWEQWPSSPEAEPARFTPELSWGCPGQCVSVPLFVCIPQGSLSLQGLKCPQEEFGDKCLNNTGSYQENDFLHMHSTSLFTKM